MTLLHLLLKIAFLSDFGKDLTKEVDIFTISWHLKNKNSEKNIVDGKFNFYKYFSKNLYQFLATCKFVALR
jgi:hypothetical protein